MSLTGKPVLLDRMNPELAPRLVELIIEDNERAQKQKAERRAKKAEKRAKKNPPPHP